MKIKEIESTTHEKVLLCEDPQSGLEAIIAIHNTRLGNSLGGCRMYPYSSREEALNDVLKLSESMTYKAAIAGLNVGGGKAVIIGHPKNKTPELLRSFGRFVHDLQGEYVTAEDVGTSVNDMTYIAEETPFVCGMGNTENSLGDPSPYTAYGVLQGIRAAVSHKMNRDSLQGIRVSVLGIGHVGYHLCHMLLKEGAQLFIADIVQEKITRFIEEAKKTYSQDVSIQAKTVDELIALDVDVFSPCAMGGILNESTVKKLQAKIVAGAANNQLASNSIDQLLFDKGILYAPDYVINGGGLISVHQEYFNQNVEPNSIFNYVKTIYSSLMNIFELSQQQQKPTAQIANALAESRFSRESVS
ncbi:MAG: hypothetical protein A2Y14_02930 [Verrucomicrobia bacterium GWF2_51_19]|nr:MAG: hypothetical protein A2Y14_02930 [Verrucomicrobia bacterium GWF2_51_19]HCJ11591.1 amino acid dehydrogenase [Opitutae bacterium]